MADRPTTEPTEATEDEIEITPEMIAAGIWVIDLGREAYSDEMTASEVYKAMLLVKRHHISSV